MTDRYPGYDVLAKRGTPSWNPQTRSVVDRRLALAEAEDVLSDAQRVTLRAVAARVVPQPEGRPPVNIVALLLERIAGDVGGDGYRPAGLPKDREAWARGLDAIEAEAQARHRTPFAELREGEADAVLTSIERGVAQSPAWGDMLPDLFWSWRLLPDLVSAYYAHPSAWSAIGFGGPASPRGYVRMEINRRDPWEAVESRNPTTLPFDRGRRDDR